MAIIGYTLACLFQFGTDVMIAILQFIPVVVLLYFAGYKHDNFAAAQWTFISAGLMYLAIFILQKFKLDKKQMALMVITLALSGITYFFHDDRFIRLKGPIVFFLQGIVFLASPLVLKGTTLVEKLFHEVLEMPKAMWHKLNWAWAIFSFILAGLNYWVAFTFPQYWAQFKIFGSMGLMIAFVTGMFIALKQYMKDPPAKS